MSSNIHLEAQHSKKFDMPLSHLDYNYIDSCSNVKELEKIVLVLRSGEEGRFPDLERHAEKKLSALNPKSRVLRKDGPILRPGDISSGDWKNIEDDLTTWTKSMNERDSQKQKNCAPIKAAGDAVEVDENLPPVRSGNVVLEGKKQKKANEEKKNKRVMPRDYKEWEKVDIDAELEKVDSDKESKNSNASKKSNLNGVTLDIDTSGMTEEQKQLRANREKDKGNEAFRSHDYDESVAYYSRSISLSPLAASYNNRALAYLKLEKWDQAIKDCNCVLNLEIDNIKALLRRGTAYKSKKDLSKAEADLLRVLNMEPQNKKAQDLLAEVKKEVKEKKEKGRRMVIEEVEEESEGEEVEAEKPPTMVNGFGSHDQDETPEDAKIVELTDEGSEVRARSKTREKSVEQESPVSSCSSSENHVLPSSKQKCSDNQDVSSSSSPVSALPESEASSSQSSVSPSLTPLSSSSSSRSLDSVPESSVSESQSSMSSADQVSDAAKNESVDTTSQQFVRPQYVQRPLPPAVLAMKEEGNNLFRSGQYASAIDQYSKAISSLEKATDQTVNTSVLLSNRAACHLKTGNCPAAVKDCCQSLQLIPHSSKALLRRAAAYEALEKYGDAYIDYKHVLSVDMSALQASQGASRCQGLLQQRYGASVWREKIKGLVYVQPWEVPQIVSPGGSESTKPAEPQNSAQTSTSKPSTTSKPPAAASKPVSPKPEPVKEKIPTKEEKFEALKTKGNQHVQKGEYKEASNCYSQCIALCADQVACYTNRALCYLKLNKPTDAECDCDQALSLQPTNPKALYRRALARKSLQQYKSSLQDLVELLKLEPKNTAAKKEMDVVKQCYKEELQRLKQKVPESDSKVRKRMKIEEVDDDEEEDKPQRSKAQENKSKSQSKSRSNKSSQPNSGSRSKTSDKRSSEPVVTQSPPVNPPIAPRLIKSTPYEFCQAWNSLKPCQGVQPYAEILRQVAPSDLPTVISNKLDGEMLHMIVRCVSEEMVLKGEVDRGYQILDNLCKVPRFSTVSLFMSTKENKEFSEVLDILSKTSSSTYTAEDLLRLKKEYSVK